MEQVRNFFLKDNIIAVFDQFYRWLSGILENVFGNYTYEPLKVLFINPYFWMILIAVILLGLLFRRR